jgi:hypothetical protein
MSNIQEFGPKTFYQSEGQKAFVIIASIVLIGLGMNAVSHKDMLGWVPISLGVFVFVGFIIRTAGRGIYLELTEEGFTLANVSHKTFYRWDEIKGFRIMHIKYTPVIVFDKDNDVLGPTQLGNYSVGREELLHTMNSYRDYYTSKKII